MRYSVYFFAINGLQVAAQFAQPEELLNQMMDRIRQTDQFSEKEVQESYELARQICAGQLPNDCEPGYFNALCWLCEVVGEKIDIPGFTLLRNASYIDDIGIWRWFRDTRPPFAVPTVSEPPPAVGFLRCSDIKSIVLPGLPELEECPDSECESARTYFEEVAESVQEDGLDLLAVLLCS